MSHIHGQPVWFELATPRGALDAAGDFYRRVLGWQIADSGMDGWTYHLATARDDMVAGLMEIPADAAGMPPCWTIYFGVDDADRACEAIRQAGGRVLRDPADVPGTGRFAIVSDPQGAAFGILRPEAMEGGEAGGRAFDPQMAAHAKWTELMTPDPEAALEFYGQLFGWAASDSMDMGEMGTYQLFSHAGADIGGMMGLADAPGPYWQVYFGVNGIHAAMERLREAGGRVLYGPQPVPGDAHIVMATDPQGAAFALVGPLEGAP